MFKLVKLGIGLVGLVLFAWFGLTVKLGSQTLFQHVRAIGQSKESHDLVDGTREAAGPFVDDVRRRIAGHDAAKPAGEHTADDSPQEHVSTSDRQALHRLIRRVDRPTHEP
jgi:hypothetical protein